MHVKIVLHKIKFSSEKNTRESIYFSHLHLETIATSGKFFLSRDLRSHNGTVELKQKQKIPSSYFYIRPTYVTFLCILLTELSRSEDFHSSSGVQSRIFPSRIVILLRSFLRNPTTLKQSIFPKYHRFYYCYYCYSKYYNQISRTGFFSVCVCVCYLVGTIVGSVVMTVFVSILKAELYFQVTGNFYLSNLNKENTLLY